MKIYAVTNCWDSEIKSYRKKNFVKLENAINEFRKQFREGKDFVNYLVSEKKDMISKFNEREHFLSTFSNEDIINYDIKIYDYDRIVRIFNYETDD